MSAVPIGIARAESAPVDIKSTDAESDPDMALAFQLQRAFQKLAARVAPAVVSLKVSSRPKNWSDELKRMSEQFGSGAPERNFEGSGVVLDADGSIITNEHVVRGADTILVTFSDGSTGTADVVGVDARSDLAMLKLKDDGVQRKLAVVQLGDSDKVQAGQYAMAVGNPFGLTNSVTMGVISARNRNMPLHGSLSDVFYGNLIQTDTPINPGNSGGPLFDLGGKLIGINTMIFSNTGYSQACGFAIPANHLKPRIAYLKAGREIEYGWLGVQLQDLQPLQKEFAVPDNKGVMVGAVIPNTPADRAGLTHGMIILNFDGTRVGNPQELISVVNETPVGRSVKVKVLDKAGRIADYAVRISKRYSELAQTRRTTPNQDVETQNFDLDELEAEAAAGLAKAEKVASPAASAFIWRGMQFKELSAAEGLKKGGRIEITRVKKSSPADRAGLYEGAVISELKHTGDNAIVKIAGLDDLKRLTASITGPVAMYTTLDGYLTLDEK